MQTKLNNLKQNVKEEIFKLLSDFARIKLHYKIYDSQMAPFVYEYDMKINDLLTEIKKIDKKEYQKFLKEICSYFVILDNRKLDLVRYDREYEEVCVLKYHPF
jgi:GTP-binding protein EngB required for normal cell division